MALKSRTAAVIFFLFAALAGGCSIYLQPLVFEYVHFGTAIVRWLFDWVFLLWASGFLLCIVLLVLGVLRLRNTEKGSR